MAPLSALLLAGAIFLLAVSPGPGVLATLARAMSSGFSSAALMVVGIVLGDLIFLLLAIFGLDALASALGNLFVLVKYLGAAYLVWLGIQLWRATAVMLATEPNKTHWRGPVISGLAITLANPKVILFYLGLLPTFVDLGSLNGGDVMALALIVASVLGSTLLAYAAAGAKARRMMRDQRVLRLANRTAGSVMIAAGTSLAIKS